MILSSSSKQRKQLLQEHGYDFEILSVETDEKFDENKTIYENIVNVAYNKAISTITAYNVVDDIVIAADTIVYCDDKILLKPVSYEDATRMLNLYKDNIVYVISGVSVVVVDIDGNTKIISFYDESKVIFKDLTNKEITKWLSLGEYMYCSGALKIEYSIEHMNLDIEGSVSNITGLPMEKLDMILKSLY